MVDEFQQSRVENRTRQNRRVRCAPCTAITSFSSKKKSPVTGSQTVRGKQRANKAQLREVEGQKLNQAARFYVENLRKSKKLEYNEQEP